MFNRYDHTWTIAGVRDRSTEPSGYIRVSYHEAVTAYIHPRSGIVEYVFYDETDARAEDFADAIRTPYAVRRSGKPHLPQWIVTASYVNKAPGNRTNI